MEILLWLHSIWRWVVVFAALAAILLSAMSAAGRRPWDSASDRSSLIFSISMDLQFLIGAILWLLEKRWSGDLVLGYLHPVAMIGAVALVHVGRSRSERSKDDKSRAGAALLFFVLSLAVVIAAIPVASWRLPQ